MKFITFDKAQKEIESLEPGDRVALLDKNGEIAIGGVRIRKAPAGQQEYTRRVHTFYVYAQYRIGKKVTEKYIGRTFESLDHRVIHG